MRVELYANRHGIVLTGVVHEVFFNELSEEVSVNPETPQPPSASELEHHMDDLVHRLVGVGSQSPAYLQLSLLCQQCRYLSQEELDPLIQMLSFAVLKNRKKEQEKNGIFEPNRQNHSVPNPQATKNVAKLII